MPGSYAVPQVQRARLWLARAAVRAPAAAARAHRRALPRLLPRAHAPPRRAARRARAAPHAPPLAPPALRALPARTARPQYVRASDRSCARPHVRLIG